MTGVGDDSRGRLVGRPWFVVGLALALAATLALVLADDIRYLRLGIVAALWAALVGAFLAVRYRKQASSTDEAVAQAQEVYELELEREIAARREYELEIESEMRSKAEADSRVELDALRSEVLALRESLQSLFGGEVLLERVALTAQATRMRALREEGHLVEAPGNGRLPAQLTAAPAKEGTERPTELIDRVRDKQPSRGRPASGAPEPRRPERSLDLPPRRVAKNEAARTGYGRSSAAASVSKAAAEARAEQTRFTQPPAEQPRVTPDEEQTRLTRAATPVRRPEAANELTRPALNVTGRQPEPEAADEPAQLDADWTPSWENRVTRDRPVSDLSAAFPANGNGGPVTPEPQRNIRKPAEPPQRGEKPTPRFEGSRPRMEPAKPAQQEPAPRFESSRPRMEPVKRAEPVGRFETSRSKMEPVPRFEGSRPRMEPVKRAETSHPRMEPAKPAQQEPAPRFESSRPRMEPVRPAETSLPRLDPVPPAEEELPAPTNPTLPEEVRRRAQEGGAGGRRRKPEPPETPAETSGGRRYRPEGEPPSWQSNGRPTGSHARPDVNGEPATGRRAKPEAHESTGHRAKPEDSTGRRAAAEETGSHTAGRSVSDLLAAHGATTDAIPRRRRRAED
ncbi:hypothetical protein HFP15_36350 [Amycolatopsis sp. K13G38]|uniref:DUF6779 domain-containing protein n=1 Tax=Amycolatopsis acididurans TaxID=2724524 RepID=A0ABX1JF27_9PSEU|nr:DUF6779 domain-containing protein [Amycolatopsis acididurans]NKQ58338.1 hypothetical protein [Amycolatopsis acididurans]